jgi:hypothetical protein
MTDKEVKKCPEQLALAASAAAEAIGLQPASLTKDRQIGHLGVPYVKAGRRVLYCLADLKTWLEEQKINLIKQGVKND